MTLVLNLSPEEICRVEGAREKGIDVDAMLHGVIAFLPPAETKANNDKTLELLAQWAKEDETDDPAELAKRDAEFEEFQANMNANRALEGRPPVYP